MCRATRARRLGWLARAAEGGNAFAQAWLGDVLAKGKGVLADPAAATQWYERAAAQAMPAPGSRSRAAAGGRASPEELARVFQLWLAAADPAMRSPSAWPAIS